MPVIARRRRLLLWPHSPALDAAGSAAYVGPGDIATYSFWGGLRGYSAAYAAPGTNPAIVVYDTATDLISTDINILSDGTLDLASLATFVGLHGSVAIGKVYDQTGNGKHM